MTPPPKPPFFSVIVPTRNRPVLFKQALDSVLRQKDVTLEVVVVVDGSDSQSQQSYEAIQSQYPDIAFHFLTHREAGHGQSYAMNYGALASSGEYVCFLDDDDFWTDDHYLRHTQKNIQSVEDVVDMHYSNQSAIYADGATRTEPTWITDLIERVEDQWRVNEDCYRVEADFLLRSAGFAHLNCSIYRRGFFERIGGLDESIRYENDRDVYLRSIDRANTILYTTRIVSQHHIPDASKTDNMSTVAPAIDKKLYQLRVYDKGIALAHSEAVRRFCISGKSQELRHLTQLLRADGHGKSAACYARQALACRFNLRWFFYTIFLSTLALLPGSNAHVSNDS